MRAKADCWLWRGGTWSRSADGRGCGCFIHKRGDKWVRELAHRYSWRLHNGEIPEGLLVCHTCDKSLCVNPDHLFLGSQTDNMLDMYKKKRHAIPRGADNVRWRGGPSASQQRYLEKRKAQETVT